MFDSLRARLISLYLGIIILGLGGLTFWSSNQIVSTTVSDYGNSLEIQVLSLGSRLGETLEYNPRGTAAVLQDAADSLQADVSLYSPSQRLQFSTSEIPLGYVDTDPFVILRDSAGTRQIIASASVYEGDDFEGYIQINVPESVPISIARQRQVTLWSVFGVIALLGISATLWLVTSLTQPLEDLQQTALDMADGDLSQRVSDPGKDEIGDVGRAFNAMAERVEAIVADQRAFASNASHELRTPLTTIRLRTEMMLNDDLGRDIEQEFIEEIDSEVIRMSGLVNDLLLLSRIDAKRLSAGNEQVDSVRLLKKVIEEYQTAAMTKNIALEANLEAESLPVRANLNHLETVFRNLIDNGLKYTDQNGRVTLRLSQDDSHMVFRVTDNGEGIPAEDLENIGKRFFRVDRARGRKVAGTGLGLALVSSILELYAGTLQVTSEGEGKGTTAEVRWPIS